MGRKQKTHDFFHSSMLPPYSPLYPGSCVLQPPMWLPCTLACPTWMPCTCPCALVPCLALPAALLCLTLSYCPQPRAPLLAETLSA